MGEYEILIFRKVCGIDVPVSFNPPLRVGRLQEVQQIALIVERQFGPIEVRLDGKRVEWREIRAAAKGAR
jgi:hypothetical protein